eukprot:TRINITY_DN8302_c0_g1_i1.p2 TRINITY_DN8302_c0_g1~~TRINITY_DN8302_c0_g1_i1.p2  ORF type:complete len:121 (+),score=7.47 TRINITY_DN8302_c0_g1_i1:80-442(+)
MPGRLVDLLRLIDVAMLHPRLQRRRSDIDELNLVRKLQNMVRHRLADTHTGNLLHRVIQALQMLHIHGRNNRDASRPYIPPIPISTPVLASGNVCMRQFIHQNHIGPLADDLIGIHLFKA